jgi:hypothetical protein
MDENIRATEAAARARTQVPRPREKIVAAHEEV